jgi:vancomycin resistance protein YoaR
VVIFACAVVALLVAVDHWANAGKIYWGVSIGGVDVGGKTPGEARQAVEDQLNAGALKEIRFNGGPEDFSLDANDISLNVDVDATVDKAYAVGREGSVARRLGNRLEAAWGTLAVAPVADYDRSAARAKIDGVASRVDAKPQDAYVSVSGADAKAVGSHDGYQMDVDGTAAGVDEAIAAMSGEAEVAGKTLPADVQTSAAEEAATKARTAISSGPISLKAQGEEWKLSPEEIGQSLSFTPDGGTIKVGLDQGHLQSALSNLYKDVNQDPVEAGYKFDGDQVVVTKSQEGRKIQEDKLFGDLQSGLFAGQHEYDVPVTTAQPKFTTEQAEQLKPTDMIGRYRTDYTLSSDKSPERVENLNIASNAINGVTLAPNEVFSLNDVASPLKYNSTMVIVEGVETFADGGGLCQVTSTLYNAANYAGLDILERHPHYAQLPYIRPGMDATVWFGSLDMRFQNTTKGYILLRQYLADDGYIYAEVWGQPTGKKVEMDSEPTYMGYGSSDWTTYEKVTENGKVTFDDVLHNDSYQALVDDHGMVIPPPRVPVAPVNP